MKWEEVSKGGRHNVQSGSTKIAPNAPKLNLFFFYKDNGLKSWLSPWKLGFEPRAVNVDCLMGEVILGQFFAEYFDFFLPNTVPLMLHSLLLRRFTCQIDSTSTTSSLRHQFIITTLILGRRLNFDSYFNGFRIKTSTP
jgi:hypothetical protein